MVFSRQVALSNGTPVPAVLLANKCDQRSHGLCPKLPKLENFSRQCGFVGWYETSAKVRRVDHFPPPLSVNRNLGTRSFA